MQQRTCARLGPQKNYSGIDRDIRDFPFITVLGLSSYPYLGGFSEPEQIPIEYYSRIGDAVAAFQLPFADLDLASFPQPLPKILPLFVTLGLVDSNLRSKPALATWDTIFARRSTR